MGKKLELGYQVRINREEISEELGIESEIQTILLKLKEKGLDVSEIVAQNEVLEYHSPTCFLVEDMLFEEAQDESYSTLMDSSQLLENIETHKSKSLVVYDADHLVPRNEKSHLFCIERYLWVLGQKIKNILEFDNVTVEDVQYAFKRAFTEYHGDDISTEVPPFLNLITNNGDVNLENLIELSDILKPVDKEYGSDLSTLVGVLEILVEKDDKSNPSKDYKFFTESLSQMKDIQKRYQEICKELEEALKQADNLGVDYISVNGY